MSNELPRQIDWESAQIHDRALDVALTGPGDKAWKKRFRTVLALLDTAHSNWGEVKLTDNGIKVAAVQPGSESELRHFLESIVLQVNSDVAPEAHEESDDSDGGEDERDADEEMTATFRAFASESRSSVD
jgi:hypothetical protein